MMSETQTVPEAVASGGPDLETADRPGSIAAVKTLLLIDLVNSTQSIESWGDTRAVKVLERHDRLARDLMARHGGREIDKTDGFLVLFEHPHEALECALQYHQELARLALKQRVRIHARAGIHHGEVFLRENTPLDVARGAKPLEVEGLAKPMAARVMSLAMGGQTLLTQAAFRRVEPTLAEEPESRQLRWLSYGTYRLKGIAHPVPIFEVGEKGLAPLTAPPRMVERRGARVLPWVAVLLLVALLATVSVLYWSDRVAPAATARNSIAVLGFQNQSGQAESQWLSTALAEMVSSELAVSGDLRLVSGETVARMKQELDLPNESSLAIDTLRRIRENLGIDYVVLGSYVVLPKPGASNLLRFQLTVQNTVDGNTVAAVPENGDETQLFELMARAGAELRGRMGLRDISQVEAAAMRATVPLSYEATRFYSEGLDRLRSYNSLEARQLFEQAIEIEPEYALAHAALSQAWGDLGYDVKAQESAKQAFELSQGLPRAQELAIQGLYFETAGDDEKAVQSFETLWGFFSDDIEHGLNLVQAQIDAEQIDAALATVESLRQLTGQVGEDPRIDLVQSVVAFHASEYRTALDAAGKTVAKAEARESWILVAEAHRIRGNALHQLGDYEAARRAYEEARVLFTEAGNRKMVGRILNGLAVQLWWNEGRPAEARQLYRDALEIYRDMGNQYGTSLILNNFGMMTNQMGDPVAAAPLLEESVRIARVIGSRNDEGRSLTNLALVALDQGDLETAHRLARESVEISLEIENRFGLAWRYYNVGRVALARGELEDAQTAFGQSMEIVSEISMRHLQGNLLQGLGEIDLARDQLGEAMKKFEQVEALRLELRESWPLGPTRLYHARLLLEMGRAREAAALAQELWSEFRAQERRQYEAMSAILVVRALLTQDQLDEARGHLEQARALVGGSPNPMIRLRLALAEGHALAAAGDHSEARRLLTAAQADAVALGMVGLTFEVRLGLGQAELADSAGARSRDRLSALAEEARVQGFDLIARKAEALLSGPVSASALGPASNPVVQGREATRDGDRAE